MWAVLFLTVKSSQPSDTAASIPWGIPGILRWRSIPWVCCSVIVSGVCRNSQYRKLLIWHSPPPRQKLEPPVRQNIPIFIGCFLICAPHSVPEGKRLAGSNDEFIKYLCRQLAVVGLILLIGQLIPGFVVEQGPAGTEKGVGQQAVRTCFGIAVMVQLHPHIVAEYLLFFPQRQQTRKKLCQPFSSHNVFLPVVSLTEKCSCQHHSTEQEHGVL